MFKRVMSSLFAALLVAGTLLSVVPVTAKAASEEKTYNFSELKNVMEYGLTSEITDSGELNITFNDQYKSQFYAIPEDINPGQIQKVTFEVKKGSEAALAFKLHTQDDFDSDNKEGTPVSYGKAEVVPTVPGIKYFSIMSLNTGTTDATIGSVTFTVDPDAEVVAEDKPVIEGENVIKNGNFDENDFSMWGVEQGKSVISSAESEEAVFDEIKTYGVINGRTSAYDCFAQDITDVVESGHTYAYSFYVKLSDDYAGAPGEQRQVDFAPYVVSGDNTNYLGSYSPELSGSCSQQLTPGEWTKFEGTFKVASAGAIDKVVIRILEQGTDYGEGDCVKGEYYATGVSLIDMNLETASIEEGVPNLKDTFIRDFGSDIICGTSVTGSEINDQVLMQLVEKHFNGITLGNELKPDALFGYSNDKCPATETAELNGEKITVPTLDFSRAEQWLDYINTWNEENPDSKILVRGHVLVWHSQTPEWFFHEDYDASKDYVSTEEMNKRQEWYIKTVLEHFVGEESPYKDLFYGWDVVNEAVSDSTGTYRSNTEGSSWWAVYKSNEFIINAFKFANKYAPASLELYYNDYNDCTPGKVEGIVALLNDVKSASGTRIDAMGMQGHYDCDSPGMEQFESAAKKYGDVVGKIMVTELDFKASNTYDGTPETLAPEYEKQAYRYKDLYQTMKKLNDEGTVKVGGMVVWGVIDGNSWLQAYTGVGGGVTDGRPQCPLLFDDNYHVKPAFWGIVDSTKLAPKVNTVVVNQSADGSFENATEYAFGNDDVSATFKAVWDDGVLKVKVHVIDPTTDETDGVNLYIDKYNSRQNGINPKIVTILKKDAEGTDDLGYTALFSVDLDTVKAGASIGFDIAVVDGENIIPFNDTSLSMDSSTKYYANAELKPFLSIPYGTATIDGELDEAWNDAVSVPLEIVVGDVKSTANVKLMWDETNLYAYAAVADTDLNKASEQVHEQDSFEIFIDENNSKAAEYNDGTKQYRINYENEQSFNGAKCLAENVSSFAKVTENGYIIEGAFKWTEITPEVGTLIGLELQVNDADSTAVRLGTLSWFDTTGQCWSVPECYGTAVLVQTLPKKSGNDSGFLKVAVPVATVLVIAGGLFVVGKSSKASEEESKKEEETKNESKEEAKEETKEESEEETKEESSEE